MSLDEFQGWLAYTRDHPLPDSWLQHGLSMRQYAAYKGTKSKVNDYIPIVPKRIDGPIRRSQINWAGIAQLKAQSKA